MLLNRPQLKFSLFTLPLENYTEISNGTMEEKKEGDETKLDSAFTVLVSKTSGTWIRMGNWLLVSRAWITFKFLIICFLIFDRDRDSENRPILAGIRSLLGSRSILDWDIITFWVLPRCQQNMHRSFSVLKLQRIKVLINSYIVKIAWILVNEWFLQVSVESIRSSPATVHAVLCWGTCLWQWTMSSYILYSLVLLDKSC